MGRKILAMLIDNTLMAVQRRPWMTSILRRWVATNPLLRRIAGAAMRAANRDILPASHAKFTGRDRVSFASRKTEAIGRAAASIIARHSLDPQPDRAVEGKRS